MTYLEYDSSNTIRPLSKFNLVSIIFLIISNLLLIQCQKRGTQEIPHTTPDKILIFDHAIFNAGTANKNGDLFIEYYSEDNYYDIPNSILFYGLSKDGRFCFSNETSYTQETNIGIDEIVDIDIYPNYYKIFDSKNLFVTINNDNNKENQYLFSINSYNSIVELHNLNNDKDILILNYFWN